MKPSHPDHYFSVGCGRCKLGGTPNCKVHAWSTPLQTLREILLTTNTQEELKWGVPCYTVNGKNLFILSAFKEYVSINFFKGSLISDPENLLTKPGEDTQGGRQLRFTSTEEILKNKSVILDMVHDAIEIEQKRLKVKPKEISQDDYPEELLTAFESNLELSDAFHRLTPGRQRGYLIYFNSAKQSKTKASRIEKSIPKILLGKGQME